MFEEGILFESNVESYSYKTSTAIQKSTFGFESNVESYSYKTYLMDGVSFCQV